jgi:hypothetical protein
MNRPSGNLSCISFHGVPYTVVKDSDVADTLTFDIINMKSHKTIQGKKGKLVSLTDPDDDELKFRIGLVEGLHRSNIFHEIKDSIPESRRQEPMFKLTLYYGRPNAQFLKEDCTLFAKLSYNLSLELRSGNEHTLFDAMHNCVTHVMLNGKYTCINDEGVIKNEFFVFVHSPEDITKLTPHGLQDKKKMKGILKKDVENKYREITEARHVMEKTFMEEFIANLRHNRLVTQFIEKTPKMRGQNLFNLDYLLSDNVPNVGPDTLMPLVTQGTKKKGTAISMRCITAGGCPFQLFFITSILLSTVMHPKFAEVSPLKIFGTDLYHFFSPNF